MTNFEITIRTLRKALFLVDNQKITIEELRQKLHKVANQDEKLTEDEFCQLLFENGI